MLAPEPRLEFPSVLPQTQAEAMLQIPESCFFDYVFVSFLHHAPGTVNFVFLRLTHWRWTVRWCSGLIGHIQHHRFGPHEQVQEHCVRWKHRTLRQRGQLCGSERLEDMKVFNFIHLLRWSRCDRAGCTYW